MMFVLSGDNVRGSAELAKYQIRTPPHYIISQSQLHSVHYWLFTIGGREEILQFRFLILSRTWIVDMTRYFQYLFYFNLKKKYFLKFWLPLVICIMGHLVIWDI